MAKPKQRKPVAGKKKRILARDGDGILYEMRRRRSNGELVCIELETGKTVDMGRCVKFELSGDTRDGVVVRIDQGICQMEDGLGKEWRDRASRRVVWDYSPFEEDEAEE